MADELLSAVLQVDEVGGGDLREIADFRGTSEAEIEDYSYVPYCTTVLVLQY